MTPRERHYTITLSPDADDILSPRVGTTRPYSRSGAVARALERYAEICQRHLPELPRDDWATICDACQWSTLADPRHISYAVADAICVDGACITDHHELLSTLNGLGYAGLCSVADVVERFWAAYSRDGDEAALAVLNAAVKKAK